MCLIRATKRKERCKRWLPLQQLFLVLLLIDFIAQFYVFLPRDVQRIHKSELKGSFKILQPLINQTTHRLADNTSIQPSTSPTGTIEARGNLHDNEEHLPRLTSRNQTNTLTSIHIHLQVSKQTNVFEITNATNYNRLQHLRNQCNLLGQNKTRPRTSYMRKDIVRILTNPSLTLVYCRVNKAASWYTIRLLQKILNCNEECLRRYSQRIRSFSYAKKINQMRNSFKFLFVREPYDRLFSTYCNKFYLPKGIWDPIGIDIIRRYRKNPSAESWKYGYDVTFAELVRYTVDEFEAGHKMDGHIRPMYSNCKPCDYEYDFIGKLETFKSDMEYLAHEWKIRNITTNTPEWIGEKSISFEEMYFVRAFIEKAKYSNIDVYNLFKRSWNYYQITSVISKQIDMPFSRSDDINFHTFLAKLRNANIESRIQFPDMKSQKDEALIQAYSSVPLNDLERLKAVVKEDCLLFGYEDSPNWLFDRNTTPKTSNSFNYFSCIGGN